MIDQIRPLAIFACVAETGSFRAAAQALCLSPSVVSQQLAALERRLGVALIYRSTRSFSLTPDGEKLLPSAQAVMSAAQVGLSDFTDVSSQPFGVLRIAAPAMLAPGPFLDDVKEFSDAFPGVSVSINFSDMRADVIRDGLDVAIRIGQLSDSALKSKKLGQMSRVLVASPDYVAAQKRPRSPDDLKRWSIIGFTPRSKPVELRHPSKGVVAAPCESRISVDSAIAAHRLALAGAGLAVLPDFIAAPDLDSGRLVEILPAWRIPSLGIHAIWPPNAPRKGLIQSLVELLEEKLAQQRDAHRVD